LVFASPSLTLFTLAHCFFRALSKIAKLIVLRLRDARSARSSGERGRFSWAMKIIIL
jgi:hypothetical protein